MTVSKIFILGKHEVMSTLSAYINPNDFPKRYGGNLDWDFGMVPHMDQPSLKAVEKDGRSGWVEGPCLWLDHRRFAVGSANGKLRRPDSEIASLKPVVYAADKTDEPVHPNAAVTHKAEVPVASKEPEKLTAPPEAAAAAAVPTTSHTAESFDPSHPSVSYQNTQAGAEMQTQANKLDPELTHAESAGQAMAADTGAIIDPLHQQEAHQTSPATGPGHADRASQQTNMHDSLIHDMTTKKLQEEPVSIISSNANGSAHHDELLTASDPAKGFVLETEKMNMNGQVKPSMERFVTSVEDFSAVNGRA